jgi:hypothetical protein
MIEEIQIAKERATDEKRVHGSHKAPQNKGIINHLCVLETVSGYPIFYTIYFSIFYHNILEIVVQCY